MFRPAFHVSLLVSLDRDRRALLRSDGLTTIDTNRLPTLPAQKDSFLG